MGGKLSLQLLSKKWGAAQSLSLLKKEDSYKGSIRRKRFRALMHNDYLTAVLRAGQKTADI